MKIFFLCRTGHHTSLLAAGLHLNLIKEETNLRHIVTHIRGWNDIKPRDIGTPFFVGKDKDGNEVYTIGIGMKSSMMERVINDIINMIGIEPQERRIINVSEAVTAWTKMGLALKKFHLNSLAKLLFYIGIESECKRVIRLMGKSGITTC